MFGNLTVTVPPGGVGRARDGPPDRAKLRTSTPADNLKGVSAISYWGALGCTHDASAEREDQLGVTDGSPRKKHRFGAAVLSWLKERIVEFIAGSVPSTCRSRAPRCGWRAHSVVFRDERGGSGLCGVDVAAGRPLVLYGAAWVPEWLTVRKDE